MISEKFCHGQWSEYWRRVHGSGTWADRISCRETVKIVQQFSPTVTCVKVPSTRPFPLAAARVAPARIPRRSLPTVKFIPTGGHGARTHCGWPVQPEGQLGGFLRAEKWWNLIWSSSANLLSVWIASTRPETPGVKESLNCYLLLWSSCVPRNLLGFCFRVDSPLLGAVFHFTAPILPLQPPPLRCCARPLPAAPHELRRASVKPANTVLSRVGNAHQVPHQVTLLHQESVVTVPSTSCDSPK